MTTPVSYTTDTLETIQTRVRDGEALLLDVRSQGEWDESHLELAEWIPTATICDAEACGPALANLDKEKDIYIHCKVGGRAMKCAQVMAEMGFRVLPIKAKYESFGKAGYSVIAP